MMKHTKHLLVLWAALLLGAGNAWGAPTGAITSHTNIVSGQSYYIGATISGTDKYLKLAQITTGTGITGSKTATTDDATVFTFVGSGTSWTIQLSNGNYLTLATSKANGKVNIVANSSSWTLSTVSSLIKLNHNGSYCLQANSTASATNFGSYAGTQTNVWLLPVGTPSTTYKVEPQTTTGGSIDVDPTTAADGAEITIDATPDEGYQFDHWTISPNVEFTGGKSATDAIATFTMPASDVTVSATFIPTAKYTVNFYVEGALKQSLTQTTAGAAITLPSYSGCGEYTFAGWSTTDNHSNAPEVTGSTYTPTANTNFYAVYSKTGSGNAPTAYTAGDVGNYVIATLSEGTYYALPNNPTVNSGKITGVEITTETTAGNVVYVSTSNAVGYTWTIADAANGQTISDGSKYIYHSNGGSSGTSLAYGTSTSYTWKIEKEANGLTFKAMNGTTINSRGMLCNGTTFGGYALSNEDASGYNRIVVLPIGGATTTYTTRAGCDCEAPTTPLSITAEKTALNLGKDGNASTKLSTTGGNGGTVTYSVLPSDGATISGNDITFNKAYTYTVTAKQDQNGNTCAQSASVEIEVKATPVITLMADAPIKLTADCGQTTIATVQVKAYNCGTNDVTITSDNKSITVSPVSFTPTDGKVNGTVTLSYTASTGGDSESFSAEISAKCGTTVGQNTISVTATKGGCTPSVLTFMDRGSQYKQINSHYAGQTLPANEVPDPTGVCTQPVEYIFDGWATATVDNGATSYEKVTFPYAINGNQTFYAVYKYVEDGALSNNYELISSLEELESGADYVIAAYVDQNDYALKNEVNSDGKATSVSVVCDENNIITTTDNTLIWEIEGNSTEGYTFYNALCNKYMDLCLSGTKVILSLTESPTYKYKITMTSDTEGITTSIVSTLEHTYNVFSYYDNLFNAYRSCGYNIYLYKRAIASKYTTSPQCCPTNLQKPIVTTSVADGSVKLNWTMVNNESDVADYTVACVGGEIHTTTATSYTFTGLTNCTEYTFTVKANGDGTDVCSSGVTTVTATPATGSFTVTFDYGAGAGTLTSWTSGCGNTSVTLPEPTTLPDNHTFEGWYDGTKLYASGDYEPTANITLTARYTRKAGVDVVEWDPNSVTVEIGVGGAAQVQIEKEVTSGSGTGKVADELFFSKYYEATGNVKLLALFNGTNADIDLSNYSIKLSNEGKTVLSGMVSYDITVKLSDVLPEARKILPVGQEIILISYQNDGTGDGVSFTNPDGTSIKILKNDYDILHCASDDTEHSGWSDYIRLGSTLNFSGNDAVILCKGAELIDIIGAGSASGAYLGSTITDGVISKVDFMDDPGWYNANGYMIQLDGTMGTIDNYALSTNRCLLIRRNTVVSGAKAVKLNKTDFVTLGGENGEWMGYQIPDIDAGCNGFKYVGGYDYNGYYTTYQQLTKVDLGKQNADGTYTIKVSGLNDISCSKIRINVLDGSSSSPLVSSEYKVPIMVNASDVTTTNDIFKKHKVADCSKCDVVVLNGATLEKAPDGTPNDRNEFRNMEVYAGGKLKVPSEATDLRVNKLVMRSKGDEVPVAEIDGTITITDKLYHAKRIDAARFYFFTLPYNCNVADITYYNGEVLSGNGDGYLIKYYDGAGRAIGQNAGHWEVYTGSLLEAGKGYIVAISASLNGSFESNPKKELLFPMTNALSEMTTKTVAVGTYGVGDASIGDNHKGWNLIGCPFMSNYSPIDAKGLKVGTYDDGTWDEGGKIFTYNPSVTIPYVTMPNTDGKTYTQKLASSQELQPFRSFFVQVGKVGDIISDVAFSSANRKAPRKAPAADAAVWVELTLSNATGSDATTVIVDDDKTTDYEIGADLEKMLGYAALPQFYSLKSSTRLAFNALPSALASNAVPLGFYAPASDTYTIAMNTTQAQNLEGVYLTDNVTGTVTNLLLGDYSFTSGRTLNDARFSLAVVRSVTAVDNVLLEAVTPVVHRRTLRIDNAPVGSLVRVYDTLGREVVSEQIDAETVVYQLQIPGVYHVQILSKDSKSVYKVVSY